MIPGLAYKKYRNTFTVESDLLSVILRFLNYGYPEPEGCK